MNFKLIFKNTGLYALADIFNKALSFLLLPFFTLYFTPTDYGIIDTFTIFQLILGILINWEINQALIRFVPESELPVKKRFFSSAFAFIAVNVVGFCILLLAFHNFFAPFVNRGINRMTYAIGIATVFVNILNSFFLLVSRVQMNASLVFFATLANGLVTVTFACLMVLYLNLGLQGYFIAMLAGSLSSMLILYTGNATLFNPKLIQKKLLAEMLRFSIPLVPSALGVFLTIYIDRIIIKEYFSDHDLGIFGIAYRFALIASILAGAYLSSIGPLIFKDYKKPEFKSILNGYLKIYVFISLVLLGGYALFARESILIFTSNNLFNQSMQYIYLLALNSLAFNFYVFFPSLSIAKKTFTISLINIGAAFLNLGLIVLLLPYMNIFGILVSTLASTFTIQMFTWYFGHREHKIQIDGSQIILFIVFALFFGCLNFLDLQQGMFNFNPYFFIFKIACYLLLVWGLYSFSFSGKKHD